MARTLMPADRLIEAAHRLLAGLAHPAVRPFLDLWPADAPRRVCAPASLPVLAWAGALAEGAGDTTRDITTLLADSAEALAWRQTYRAADVGAAFLARYGWTELIGLRGPRACAHLACGFLLLGPETLYPDHAHAAEELYIPLSGTAEWSKAGLREIRRPGDIILHESRVVHAMRTAAEPLLALYLWRGGDLDEKARLV